MKYSHMKLIFDLACAAILVVVALKTIFALDMKVIRIIIYLGILAYLVLVAMRKL